MKLCDTTLFALFFFLPWGSICSAQKSLSAVLSKLCSAQVVFDAQTPTYRACTPDLKPSPWSELRNI